MRVICPDQSQSVDLHGVWGNLRPFEAIAKGVSLSAVRDQLLVRTVIKLRDNLRILDCMIRALICAPAPCAPAPSCSRGSHCDSASSADEFLQLFFFLPIFGSVNLHCLARRMPLALRTGEYLPRRATSCEEANWRIYTVASQSQAVTTVTALADILLVLD